MWLRIIESEHTVEMVLRGGEASRIDMRESHREVPTQERSTLSLFDQMQKLAGNLVAC